MLWGDRFSAQKESYKDHADTTSLGQLATNKQLLASYIIIGYLERKHCPAIPELLEEPCYLPLMLFLSMRKEVKDIHT